MNCCRELRMITKDFATHYAQEWISACNAYNLERILSHYADDFEMSSPVIVQLMSEPSGTLRSKETIRTYWAKALELRPNLHVELVNTFAGASSITLAYRGRNSLSVEPFWINADGKDYRAAAYYLL